MPTDAAAAHVRRRRSVHHGSRTSTRRAFLGAGLAGSAAFVAGCTDASESPAAASTTPAGTPASPSPTGDPPSAELVPTLPAFDPDDWDSVRAQYALTTASTEDSLRLLEH